MPQLPAGVLTGFPRSWPARSCSGWRSRFPPKEAGPASPRDSGHTARSRVARVDGRRRSLDGRLGNRGAGRLASGSPAVRASWSRRSASSSRARAAGCTRCARNSGAGSSRCPSCLRPLRAGPPSRAARAPRPASTPPSTATCSCSRGAHLHDHLEVRRSGPRTAPRFSTWSGRPYPIRTLAAYLVAIVTTLLVMGWAGAPMARDGGEVLVLLVLPLAAFVFLAVSMSLRPLRHVTIYRDDSRREPLLRSAPGPARRVPDPHLHDRDGGGGAPGEAPEDLLAQRHPQALVCPEPDRRDPGAGHRGTRWCSRFYGGFSARSSASCAPTSSSCGSGRRVFGEIQPEVHAARSLRARSLCRRGPGRSTGGSRWPSASCFDTGERR